MWENVNGELIWIDKEMGWEENERYNSVGDDKGCSCGDVRNHGDRLSSSRIAVGVAGGMIAAKAAPRVGSWLLWMAGILTAIMIFM
jgi:hypothetical protein